MCRESHRFLTSTSTADLCKQTPPYYSKHGFLLTTNSLTITFMSGRQNRRRQKKKAPKTIVIKSLPKRQRYRRKIADEVEVVPATTRVPAGPERAPVINRTERQLSLARPTFPVSDDTVAWINMVVNPFGEGNPGGPRAVTAGVTDADGQTSYLLCETGHITYTTAAPAGIITVSGYAYTAGPTLFVGTGDISGVGTTCMTATATTGTSVQNTAMTGLISNFDFIRCTSAGIRVNCSSPKESSSGTLTPYSTRYCGKNAAATGSWNYNTALLTQKCGPQLNVMDGCCVRRRTTDTGLTMINPPQYYYATAPSTYGEMPLITFSGCSATTVLEIEWALHYEVRGTDASPFPSSDTNTDKNFELAQTFVNNQPMAVTGHSFLPFLRSLWGGFQKVARVVANPSNAITKIVSTLLG